MRCIGAKSPGIIEALRHHEETFGQVFVSQHKGKVFKRYPLGLPIEVPQRLVGRKTREGSPKDKALGLKDRGLAFDELSNAGCGVVRPDVFHRDCIAEEFKHLYEDQFKCSGERIVFGGEVSVERGGRTLGSLSDGLSSERSS